VASDPPARVDQKTRSVGASERDEPARAQGRHELSQVQVRRLVFVDESGTHTRLARKFAWARRGHRAHVQIPRTHGQITTLVAALTWNGLQAPWTVEGAMDTAAFVVSVRDVLAPSLQPGQMVILDNLSGQKAPLSRALSEARGCELRFLPAYSPDLTPIAPAFSKRKAHLRRLAARTREALLDALALALEAITLADAHGWFRHAGYSLLAQAP
jgi:transposase